jgi:hypothetical protein
MLFRQMLHEDLGCASYLIRRGEAAVIDPKWELEDYLQLSDENDFALTSSAALVAHLASDGIDWPVTASFTAAAGIGALAGTRTSDRVPLRRL